MKKLFLVFVASLAMSLCSNAYGQINPDAGAIKYVGFAHFENADGKKIQKDEMQNYFTSYQYTDYTRAKRQLTAGYILAGIGAVGILACPFNLFVLNNQGFDANGLPYLCIGAFFGVLGAPFITAGHIKCKRLESQYNSNLSPTLTFGGQRNGIGLAFNF